MDLSTFKTGVETAYAFNAEADDSLSGDIKESVSKQLMSIKITTLHGKLYRANLGTVTRTNYISSKDMPSDISGLVAYASAEVAAESPTVFYNIQTIEGSADATEVVTSGNSFTGEKEVVTYTNRGYSSTPSVVPKINGGIEVFSTVLFPNRIVEKRTYFDTVKEPLEEESRYDETIFTPSSKTEVNGTKGVCTITL